MTRRGVLGGTGMLTAALLTGCGSHRGGRTAGVRHVDSAHGRVQVPARAHRIVCLDLSKIERMLDVGVRPVAVPEGWEPLPAHADWYAAVAKTGTQAAIDVEKVAGARPDLILGTPIGVTDSLYATLRRIAPTVVLQAPGAGAQWKQLSAADADAAGRRDGLGAVRGRYAERVRQVRTRHSDALAATTWGLAYGLPGSAYAFGRTAGMAEVLLDVGARLSHADTAASGVAAVLSYEQLDRFADADVILADARADGTTTAATARLLAQPTFRTLPAATAHRVYPLSHLLVFSYGEALALLDQIDAIAARLDR